MEKLKKLYKKYSIFNLKELFFLIIFIVFCFYDTGYTVYKPGGIVNMNSRVIGDNIYSSEGSFNMAYVTAIKGRTPIYLLSKFMPNWEVVKNSDVLLDNETMEDVNKQDKLDYEEAISNAKYVAFNKANINYKILGEHFYAYYITKDNVSDLKVGDELLSYNNIKFKSTEILSKYINDLNGADSLLIKYKRNKKEYETYSKIYEDNGKKLIGISSISILDLESSHNINIKNKESESGPSGGLIMALSIYNAITEGDITKGNKIVGTGTISRDGTVGEIGGVNYKLASAVKEGATVFICPNDNYDEVMEEMEKYNYNIKIINVATFDEAIEKLAEL